MFLHRASVLVSSRWSRGCHTGNYGRLRATTGDYGQLQAATGKPTRFLILLMPGLHPGEEIPEVQNATGGDERLRATTACYGQLGSGKGRGREQTTAGRGL